MALSHLQCASCTYAHFSVRGEWKKKRGTSSFNGARYFFRLRPSFISKTCLSKCTRQSLGPSSLRHFFLSYNANRICCLKSGWTLFFSHLHIPIFHFSLRHNPTAHEREGAKNLQLRNPDSGDVSFFLLARLAWLKWQGSGSDSIRPYNFPP